MVGDLNWNQYVEGDRSLYLEVEDLWTVVKLQVSSMSFGIVRSEVTVDRSIMHVYVTSITVNEV